MAERSSRGRVVGLRAVVVAVAALLALAGLTACRTNVGTAATVNGDRISENTVGDYLTSDAKPYVSGTTSIPPRSFVLRFLIEQRLISALFATPPASTPQRSVVDSAVSQALAQAGGRAEVVRTVGLGGYTTSFQNLFIRTVVLENLLHQEAGDSQNQATTADLARALKFDAATRFRVRVNPRYGSWDATTLALNAEPALPTFLKLQPTAPAGT